MRRTFPSQDSIFLRFSCLERCPSVESKMAVTLCMFEHASGYGLFHVKEFEEISMLQSAVEESVTDISSFNSVISLQAFQPFKNAEDALANINAVSEGLCSDQLKFFLQSNMPKKLKKVTLGVLDPKLGAAVSEAIGVKVLLMF